MRPGELYVREGYNLGYLLSWSSFRSTVKALIYNYAQEIELNPTFEDIHNFSLTNAVSGMQTDLRPENLSDSIAIRDEIVCRLSMVPLDHEVDSEIHSLLGSVSWAQGYVDYFSKPNEATSI
jgi:hypothetical protein